MNQRRYHRGLTVSNISRWYPFTTYLGGMTPLGKAQLSQENQCMANEPVVWKENTFLCLLTIFTNLPIIAVDRVNI